jgi:hypothetical protein
MATATKFTAPTDQHELTVEELDQVSGGMKWERGHKSPNVIDARGGQLSFHGWMVTLDVNGKVSSVGPAPPK